MRKTPKTIRWVKRLFRDKSKHIIFQNAKFDLKMFSFEGIDVFNIKPTIHCTLILSKLFNENGNHDLVALSKRYLDVPTQDKDEIAEWVKSNNKPKLVKERGRKLNFSDAPIEMVKRRNLWDVRITLALFAKLYPPVRRRSFSLYRTEIDLTFVCMDMENTGVRVDISRAKQLRNEAIKGINKIQADLDELICPLTIEKKKKGEIVKEVVDSFKSSSNKHLPAAFKKMGITLKYKTKPKKNKKKGKMTGGGNWSFDEYAMIRYVSQSLAAIIKDSGEEGWSIRKFYNAVYDAKRKYKLHDRELLPPLILKLRELSNMVSTYYDHIINDSIDIEITPAGKEYGILHCRFNQSEAMTGRFSSSSPNLQNMPRLLGPRECFVPRKGKVNLHLDYEQVEMKFFVIFAEDKKMAKAIEDDIHKHVAAEIYSKALDDITSEQRKRAKGVNFGIIYGSGPATMAETLTRKGLITTKLEATILVANYHRSFPSVRRVTQKLKQELIRNGYVTNLFGRRYHIPPRYAYKALNYLCQGTSADQVKEAMVKIWKWLRKENIDAKLIKTIHDEIVIECPKRLVSMVAVKAKQIMEDKKSYMIDITVDAEINDKRWSKKRKFKTFVA